MKTADRADTRDCSGDCRRCRLPAKPRSVSVSPACLYDISMAFGRFNRWAGSKVKSLNGLYGPRRSVTVPPRSIQYAACRRGSGARPGPYLQALETCGGRRERRSVPTRGWTGRREGPAGSTSSKRAQRLTAGSGRGGAWKPRLSERRRDLQQKIEIGPPATGSARGRAGLCGA